VVRYVCRHFGSEPLKAERPFFDLINEERKFVDKTVRQRQPRKKDWQQRSNWSEH